jgi:putative selenium metabolism hydrolase
MNQLDQKMAEIEKNLIGFTRELVRIKSYSGGEKEIIEWIAEKMKMLGYDEVIIDSMGNVVGRIGSGEQIVMLDSHVDTVEVKDENEWSVPPFSGDIVDGRLYGRGSVDMKSSAAASIYAGVLAKEFGWDQGKTIYVSCTVLEEDCDGENLKHLFKELNIKPNWMIICEPSNNLITLGHKGKAQIVIRTHGISAHGSAPEKGKNAVYEMADIIKRVEEVNNKLFQKEAPRGTLVLSQISSVSASLNAVPFECEIYLDRRMVVGETEETVKEEMADIIEGKDADWELGTLKRTSWTGLPITYEPIHPAWKIEMDHPLTMACRSAYEKTFGHAPEQYDYWDFSTNAVSTVSLGIPTIGFGPGEYKLAHMRDENCEVSQIVDACRFYTMLIHELH